MKATLNKQLRELSHSRQYQPDLDPQPLEMDQLKQTLALQLEELAQWGKLGIISAENKYLFGRDYQPSSELSIMARQGGPEASINETEEYAHKQSFKPYNDNQTKTDSRALTLNQDMIIDHFEKQGIEVEMSPPLQESRKFNDNSFMKHEVDESKFRNAN